MSTSCTNNKDYFEDSKYANIRNLRSDRKTSNKQLSIKLNAAVEIQKIAPKTSRNSLNQHNISPKANEDVRSPMSRNVGETLKFPLMSSSSSNSPVLRAHVNSSNFKAQNF